VYEYINAPFDISDGIYGSTFYMLTGLHGMHVIVGTLFLIVAVYRMYRTSLYYKSDTLVMKQQHDIDILLMLFEFFYF